MKGKDSFESAAALLPRDIRGGVLALRDAERAAAEEVRLRCGHPPAVLLPGGERTLGTRAVTPEDLASLLEAATHGSAHTALAGLRAGYVPLPGGGRLGVCGEAALDAAGRVELLRARSAAIRIARERRGCADGIKKALLEGGFCDTLIVSPPGAGKTTLLRELVRLLSVRGERVAVADERAEVAGGEGGFDLGPRTDVMSGAPKAAAALMLIRSMSPTVLAMDEITAPEDVEAVLSAAGCGVAVLATAHAEGLAGLRRRALDEGVFRRYVAVRRRPDGAREYEVKAAGAP